MFATENRVVVIDNINGVEYDTRKAEAITFYDNGLEEDNPCFFKETLYRKRDTGEYFMQGEGGVQTVYCGGVRLIPMLKDDVKAWVLNYFDDEFYRDVFGKEVVA